MGVDGGLGVGAAGVGVADVADDRARIGPGVVLRHGGCAGQLIVVGGDRGAGGVSVAARCRWSACRW